jgi:hypothetical protein
MLVGLISAALRYAPAYGSAERFFCFFSRHLFLSAQARLGNMPGYYQPSLAGLERVSSEVCPALKSFPVPVDFLQLARRTSEGEGT